MPSLQSGFTYEDEKFENLKLDGVKVDGSSFIDCIFEGCSLVETVLQSCRFQRCTFLDCNLSLAEIPASEFGSMRFKRSKLVGIDWTKAKSNPASLGKPLYFEASSLNHSTFIGLDMQKVQFIECIVHEVDFRETDLTRAQFIQTDLQGSLFMDTILRAAHFHSARNYNIDPVKNDLSGARFSLPEAMSLLYALDIKLIEGEQEP
jgi:uncharacterized protein YjbI with pentapeptide repeats